MRVFVCGLGILGLLLGAASAQAKLWQWNNIPIDGLQVVPVNATPGIGSGMATLNDATGLMNISGSYSSLLGTATLSHLHAPAPPGVNASPIIALSNTGGSSGTFTGSGTLSAANITNVLNGLSYINIHSTFDSGGEIRGQLWAVPEPGSLTLLGTGLASVCVVRRRLRRSR